MPTNTGQHFFQHANRLNVQGEFYQAQNISIERGRQLNGFEILLQNICREAFHNSNDQFDPPRCHPNTRIAVLKRIASWVDDPGSKKIMWLHGHAGTGKSAIARSISEQLEMENKLAASFFFSRTAASKSGRDSARFLIATIAYQIAISFPHSRDFIAEAVEHDPAVFSRSLETQIQHLLVKPLLSSRRQEDGQLKLIVIDGLDECTDAKVQRSILNAVSATLSKYRLPFCFLICSRPELHIRRAFNQYELCSILDTLMLDDSLKPDNDIEIFLKSKFDELKKDHPLHDYISETWPSNLDIQTLVQRSCGQFIYSTTVINYIGDPARRPDFQLNVILGISPPRNGDTPFAQLDMLYKHILSGVADWTLTLQILNFIHPDLTTSATDYPLQLIGSILSIEPGDAELAVSGLHSVLLFERKEWSASHLVRFSHKSLPDFLVDRSRCGEYFLDIFQAQEDLALASLHHLTTGAITDSRINIRQMHNDYSRCCPDHCSYESSIKTPRTCEEIAECCSEQCWSYNAQSRRWCDYHVLRLTIIDCVSIFIQNFTVLDASRAQKSFGLIDPTEFIPSLFERKTANPVLFCDVHQRIPSSLVFIMGSALSEGNSELYYQIQSGFEKHIIDVLGTYPQGNDLLLFIAVAVCLAERENCKAIAFKILSFDENTQNAFTEADEGGLQLLSLWDTRSLCWYLKFLQDYSRAGKYWLTGDINASAALCILQHVLDETKNDVSEGSPTKTYYRGHTMFTAFEDFIPKSSPFKALAVFLRSIDFDSQIMKTVSSQSPGWAALLSSGKVQETAMQYLQKYDEFCVANTPEVVSEGNAGPSKPRKRLQMPNDVGKEESYQPWGQSADKAWRGSLRYILH